MCDSMNQMINKLTKFLSNLSKQQFTDINEDTIKSYASFYLQQAHEIKKHLMYEHDLSESTSGNDSIVMKFDINVYIKWFDRYWEEKRIYNGFPQDGYYELLLITLIPGSAISDLLPTKIRKLLFLGLVDKTVERSGIERKIVIKYIWEYVSSLNKPLNNVDPDKVLDLFKEAIGELDRKNFQKANSQMTNSQKLYILTEILTLNRIRTSHDLKRLLAASSFIGFTIKSFILILAGVFSFYFYVGYAGSKFTDTVYDIPVGLIQFAILLAVIWVFLFVIMLSTYIYAKTRKKTLFRSISAVTRILQIKPEVLKVYFKNKYFTDYRKIR